MENLFIFKGWGVGGRAKFALNASGPFVIPNVEHCDSHLQLTKYRLNTLMRKFKGLFYFFKIASANSSLEDTAWTIRLIRGPRITSRFD